MLDHLNNLPPQVQQPATSVLRAINTLPAPDQSWLREVSGCDQRVSLFLLSQFWTLTRSDAQDTDTSGKILAGRYLSQTISQMHGGRIGVSPRECSYIFGTLLNALKQEQAPRAVAALLASGLVGQILGEQKRDAGTQLVPLSACLANGNFLELAPGPGAAHYFSPALGKGPNHIFFLERDVLTTAVLRESARIKECDNRVRFVCGDICDAPHLFENRSFQAIHLRNPNFCFEEQGRSSQDLNMAKLGSLLKPGGYLIVGFQPSNFPTIPERHTSVHSYLQHHPSQLLSQAMQQLTERMGWDHHFGRWCHPGNLRPGETGVIDQAHGVMEETIFAFRRPY